MPKHLRHRHLPGDDHHHDDDHHHEEERRDPHGPFYWRNVSWRDLLGSKVFTFVEQQPDEPGCPGFAVAAAMRANLALHRETYARRDAEHPGAIKLEKDKDPGPLNPYFLVALSEQKEKLYGSSLTSLMENTLKIADQYGAPPAGVGPERASEQYRPSDADLAAASANTIQGFQHLGNHLDERAAWLHLEGPFVEQMNVDREMFDKVTAADPWLRYRPGLEPESTLESKIYASHAMIVVGYNNPEHPKFPDSFIVMNTWRNWGDDGFAYIKVDDAIKCFISGYGLSMRERAGYNFKGALTRQGEERLKSLRERARKVRHGDKDTGHPSPPCDS